jgi:hypothetical protein
MSKPGDLKGARVLVAEDEALIAFELEAFLTEAGAIVIGPSYDLGDAVLDIRLGEETIARGIPFLFYSGHTDPILAEWPHSTLVPKPASPRIVVHALAQLLHH